MSVIWWGITGGLVTAGGILSARLWRYRKQINHMRKELALLKEKDTNYQMTSYCHVGKTEEIISEINSLALEYKTEKNRLQNENRVYRESITSISMCHIYPYTPYLCKGVPADAAESKYRRGNKDTVCKNCGATVG